MKNRKGFTLIELLITIVIIISILILAIVNVNNISKKNKDKAWEKVKNEVELAAKDYYDTNSYKLAGLDNSSIYARVSVDTLVENDFLNVVTDPRNGNRVNSCDYVEVKLENDNYSYKYHENSSSIGCDLEEVIEIKEVGAPDLELNMSKNPDGKNKYYISDVNVVATVKTNGNGAIKNVKYSFNNEEDKNLAINSNNVYEVQAIDGNSVTVTFSATNLSDKSVTKTITYKKDTKKPKVTLTVKKDKIENIETYSRNLTADELSKMKDYKSGTWINKGIYFSVKFNDEISGIDKSNTYCTDSRSKKDNFTAYRRAITTSDFLVECWATDKAGNESEKISYNAKIDLKKPTCTVSFDGKRGWNNWFITKDVSVNLSKKDEHSGIKEFGLSLSGNKNYNNMAKGTQTNETNGTAWHGYVKDEAGNENECSSIVKLEKNVSISFDKSNTNDSNSTKAHKGKIFNKAYKGTCGYGECSDIKCIGETGKKAPKDYFAIACMDVYSYPRYFYVNSVSTGKNRSVNVTDLVDKNYDNPKTPGMKRIKTLSRFDCKNDWDSDYKYNECGGTSGTKNDFSAHVYKYVSESGLQSNEIRLYTEYKIDCNY